MKDMPHVNHDFGASWRPAWNMAACGKRHFEQLRIQPPPQVVYHDKRASTQ